MPRSRIKNAGHTLHFDGLAQMPTIESIPIEHDPLLAPATASCVTHGITPAISAPTNLAVATASAVTRGITPALVVPAFGANGAYTFFCDLESGGQVTYSLLGDPIRTVAGGEYRQQLVDYPRRTYTFTALLSDDQARDIKSALVKNLAQAQPFNLGLPHEALTTNSPSSGNTVFVTSTALSDWVVAGRRCIVLAADGSVAVPAVVGTSTGTSIGLSVDPTLTSALLGQVGCLVMPSELVYLEAAQAFGYQPNALEVWNLKCTSALADPALGVIGTGAATRTHFTGPTGYVGNVWDYPLSANELVQTSVQSNAEAEDAGGLVALGSVRAYSDLTRSVGLRVNNDARRQWVKAFWMDCLGSQVPFYLPTWKDDLVVVAQVDATHLKVESKAVAGGGDYTQWFNNGGSQRSLQLIYSTGTIGYVNVTSATDNGDGTITLVVSSYTFGTTLSHVSFLELVRFADDVLTFDYAEGATPRVQLVARTVVQ